MNHTFDTGTTAGTVGGTLLTVLMNVYLEDISRTMVLATVGAVVSFLVSLGCKWVWRKFNSRNKNKFNS